MRVRVRIKIPLVLRQAPLDASTPTREHLPFYEGLLRGMRVHLQSPFNEGCAHTHYSHPSPPLPHSPPPLSLPPPTCSPEVAQTRALVCTRRVDLPSRATATTSTPSTVAKTTVSATCWAVRCTSSRPRSVAASVTRGHTCALFAGCSLFGRYSRRICA